MPSKKGWERYIDDVCSGKRLAGELEKLSVLRCKSFMSHADYYLDDVEANWILDVFSLFRHTKGEYAGKLFELMDWQEFFLVMLFALKVKKTKKRLFRKALLCVPKKNGKSEFAGAIGVVMTYFEKEEGAECYSAANKYDQAMYSWDAARKIVKRLANESPELNNRVKTYESINTRSLLNTYTDGFFKPIASDSKTLDGVNPYLAIIDEYHEASTSAIPDNMESGMVSREQPLLLITTTRGFNIMGPLWQLEKSYSMILRGQLKNDAVFPMIYTLDEDDDWTDESIWAKANPGLGRTPILSGLQAEFAKAQTEGASREISFKTKNLNIWTSVSETFIKDSDFMAGATKWDVEEMKGHICFAGLDLAQTRDITAIAYLFPPQQHYDKFRVWVQYYVPEDNAADRARRDRVPYLDWGNTGAINLTPGNVTDYDLLQSKIIENGAKFSIKGMAYDKWNATHLATQLFEQGIKVREFAQTTTKFNEPIRFLEKTILEGKLDHNKDPVLRWMFSNIQTYIDGNGNIKFDKGRSREKIDGAVALAMAFDEYLKYKLVETPDFDIVWM